MIVKTAGFITGSQSRKISTTLSYIINEDLESFKKHTAIIQPTEGGLPMGVRWLQGLFICQPAALETRKPVKPVKGGSLDRGVAACEQIAGANFILPLYLYVSI